MRRPSFVTVLVGVLLSSALLAGSAGATGERVSSTSGAAVTARAEALVTKYFTLLQGKDETGLAKFLSPAFELQRADGTGSGRAEYLQNLPTVESFELTDFTASRTGDVIAVRYFAAATGIVDGRPYTPGVAPRLSVFSRDGDRWQIVAHANFNPLAG